MCMIPTMLKSIIKTMSYNAILHTENIVGGLIFKLIFVVNVHTSLCNVSLDNELYTLKGK